MGDTDEPIRRASIVRVQSLVRKNRARKEYTKLLMEKFEEEDRKYEEEQARDMDDGWSAIQKKQEEEKREDEHALAVAGKIREEKARKIQRAFRSHQSRKRRPSIVVLAKLQKSSSLKDVTDRDTLELARSNFKQKIREWESQFERSHHRPPEFADKQKSAWLVAMYKQYKAVGMELLMRDGQLKLYTEDELLMAVDQAIAADDARALRNARRAAKDAIIFFEGEYALFNNGTRLLLVATMCLFSLLGVCP
eukprot:TRINITY_DN4254_c0_g1_i2.p1 TRINITY_DN4254_c0_g1~~TRINITY_DN4254_c0_g1_i2.p1  ORF type:complete len:251 (+),score=51.96 TRINITY_DN4254_c0_g1_i2:87-839(+)